ncbi:hypothetical protein CLU79DRAFT_4998 [Phycomyces nitens]|nr:hypothetical protein CLU79DRAFT_4998 [Phycomyces nitens]
MSAISPKHSISRLLYHSVCTAPLSLAKPLSLGLFLVGAVTVSFFHFFLIQKKYLGYHSYVIKARFPALYYKRYAGFGTNFRKLKLFPLPFYWFSRHLWFSVQLIFVIQITPMKSYFG